MRCRFHCRLCVVSVLALCVLLLPVASASVWAASGNWFVIAGSFHKNQRGAAERLASRWDPKFVRIVDTDRYANLKNGLWAVVFGPFAQKREAKDWLERLKYEDPGFRGYVKNGGQLLAFRPHPPASPPPGFAQPHPPSSPPPPPAPPRNSWFVIAGSFHKNQRGAAERLASQWDPKFVHIVDTDQYANLKDGLWAVAFGPFADKREAKDWLDRLKYEDPGFQGYVKNGGAPRY